MALKNIKEYYKEMVVFFASLAAIVGVVFGIIIYNSPRLYATVDSEYWQAPFSVENELKGINELSKQFNQFQKTLESENAIESKTVCDSLEGLIRFFDNILTYETNNVGDKNVINTKYPKNFIKPKINHRYLNSMHTILLENKGKGKGVDVELKCENAEYKYIEYKREGEEVEGVEGAIKCKEGIPFGILKPDETVIIRAWSTNEPGRDPQIKIDHSTNRCAHLYIRIPTTPVLQFVNKYFKASVSLTGIILIWSISAVVILYVLRKRAHRQTTFSNSRLIT